MMYGIISMLTNDSLAEKNHLFFLKFYFVEEELKKLRDGTGVGALGFLGACLHIKGSFMTTHYLRKSHPSIHKNCL